MRRHELLPIVLVCGLAASMAQAGFNPGNNPYGPLMGTGTSSSNSASGIAPWRDEVTYNSAYIYYGANPPPPPMFYEETWTEAQAVTDVLLESNRDASGEVLVGTSLGGPITTSVGTFNMASNAVAFVDVNRSDVYGLRIVVDGLFAHQHFQMGEAGVFSLDHGPNLAMEGTQITSPNPQWNNSVIDENNGTEWRSNPNEAVNYVGFEFPNDETRTVQAIRTVCSTPHGGGWNWTNYDVQVKQGGVWTTLGQVNTGGKNAYWVDFVDAMDVQGIRVYGSTQGGNNPGDKIIDELYAFGPVPSEVVIPEPATMLLLGLGGAGLLLRRRRA